jgi:hypothetical protein
MDQLTARVAYMERLISAKDCDESVLSQITLLQEKLEPFTGILSFNKRNPKAV